MPRIDGYLFFNGNCAETMHFYQRTLGGKLDMMTHRQSPMADQVPAATANLIIHARLEVDGGGVVMASDWISGQPYEKMQGFSLSADFRDVATAKRVFEALSEGGEVSMPFGPTFWAEAFAMLADRYGTRWMVNVAKKA